MNGNLLDQLAYEPPVGKSGPNWLFMLRRTAKHPRQFNGPRQTLEKRTQHPSDGRML